MNDIVNKLMIENELLKKKNIELEEKLKTYTNTERHKRYYENNSEKVKEKAKNIYGTNENRKSRETKRMAT
jgi:hypothetical protein